MFSHRVRPEPKNRQTLRLEEKRQRGEGILDLTNSNPTHAGLDYPDEEIRRAICHAPLERYDPAPFGDEKAREAVAAYYAERCRDLSAKDVLLTASTSESYSHLFKLLANPGENILVPRPSYPLFDFLASGEGVEPRSFPLFYEGCWELDADALEHQLDTQSKAIVIVHPNNPTGSFVKPEEWDRLLEICRRRRLPLICDEVFFDYRIDESVVPAEPLEEQDGILIFVLSGLSKLVALPQMKLGWMVVRGPGELKEPALERLEILCDSSLSVSTPVQGATPALLGLRNGMQSQIQMRLRKNLEVLHETLAKSPVSSLRVEGGWSVVLRLPKTRSDEEWALELLDRKSVLTHPGYFFNFAEEAILVASLLTSPATFTEGLRRLVDLALTE